MIATRPLGHVAVSSGSMEDAVSFVGETISRGGRKYCIALNLSKYVMAKSDEKLREVIRRADLVVADGVPIVHLSRRAGINGVHRITGIDLAERVLCESRDNGWPVFFLGAKQENLEAAVGSLRDMLGGLPVAGTHNGYFGPEDVDGIIDEINTSGAKVLLLGMGLPQKEYFVADHLGRLNVNFVITVGGAFDIWSGKKKRSPRLVQRLGLEWLYRSFYDISRAKLIVRYGMIFLKDYIRYKP